MKHPGWFGPALLAFSSTTLAFQEGLSIERPGAGEPVCGLGRAFHAGRRAELRRRIGSGLLLFRGLPDTRGNLAFRQDKTFWYLTGIESANAALLMDAGSGEEILFLPARTPRLAMLEGWEGEIWDAEDEWVGALTGFEDVRSQDDLEQVLLERLATNKEIGISMYPWIILGGSGDRAGPHDERRRTDPFDGRGSREQALERVLSEVHGAEVRDVSDVIVEMRRVKTAEEVEAMRRAARAGAQAMSEAMRSTRPGVGEWELESLMSFVQVVEGAAGAAYHGIVGGGPNSCVLHYSANNRRVEAGEVVLIDYGPEVDHYTTDITRTWPVDGEFSERQRELYDAVLEAQLAGIAAVKPGATLRDVNAAANEVLRELGFGHLIKHGVCHYIGMEVHDPGDYNAPFEPGVAFTVEPGLYEVETGIGIRIEDVVVVTEDGCEVLSEGVPKDRDRIRKRIREEGILDRLHGKGD